MGFLPGGKFFPIFGVRLGICGCLEIPSTSAKKAMLTFCWFCVVLYACIFFSVEPEAPPIVALCVPPRPGPGPHRRHVAPAGPPPRHTGASLDLSPASKSRRALVHAMAMTPDRLKVEILWTLYWLLCPGLAEGGLDIEPDGMGRGMNGPLGILYVPPLRWGGSRKHPFLFFWCTGFA